MLASLYFKTRLSTDAVRNDEDAPEHGTVTDDSQDVVRHDTLPTAEENEHASRQFVTSAEVFRHRDHLVSSGVAHEPETDGNSRVSSRSPPVASPAAAVPVNVGDIPLPQPTSAETQTRLAVDDASYASARVPPFNGTQSYNTANAVVQRLKEIAGPRCLQADDAEFEAIANARRIAFFRTLFTGKDDVNHAPLLRVSDAPPAGGILPIYHGGYAQTMASLNALQEQLQ